MIAVLRERRRVLFAALPRRITFNFRRHLIYDRLSLLLVVVHCAFRCAIARIPIRVTAADLLTITAVLAARDRRETTRGLFAFAHVVSMLHVPGPRSSRDCQLSSSPRKRDRRRAPAVGYLPVLPRVINNRHRARKALVRRDMVLSGHPRMIYTRPLVRFTAPHPTMDPDWLPRRRHALFDQLACPPTVTAPTPKARDWNRLVAPVKPRLVVLPAIRAHCVSNRPETQHHLVFVKLPGVRPVLLHHHRKRGIHIRPHVDIQRIAVNSFRPADFPVMVRHLHGPLVTVGILTRPHRARAILHVHQEPAREIDRAHKRVLGTLPARQLAHHRRAAFTVGYVRRAHQCTDRAICNVATDSKRKRSPLPSTSHST